MRASKNIINYLGVLAFFVLVNAKAEEEYFFDDNMIPWVDSISKFNKPGAFAPGSYEVSIFLNGEFKVKATVEFKEVADDEVKACLTRALLSSIGIKEKYILLDGSERCLPIDEAIAGSKEFYNSGNFRLDLQVPQMYVHQTSKGYVDPAYWEEGETMAFSNYMASYYYSNNKGGGSSFVSRNTYIGYNAGFNFGLWRFRQVGSWNHSDNIGSKWNRNQSYFKRSIPTWKSELTLGESSTPGRFFSGLNYRGVALSTDERMKPDYQRYYAPVIQGIAKTNAIVRIRQNNREIYQTNVASGPFEIGNLQASNLSGDLEVIVEEADGEVSSFIVPFASIPNSLRMGQDRYDVTIGQTRDVGDHDGFAQVSYERGLSNSITLNSGFRVGENYQALALGGVYANRFGAFGFNNTFSNTNIPGEGKKTGWMGGLTYSQRFDPTDTMLTLAGYRYSTEGYREFADVVGLRKSYKKYGQGSLNDWYSSTYMQRSRFEVMINQSLKEYGNLFVSASHQTYRGGRGQDTQYQAGYSKVLFNNISLSINISRQTLGVFDPSGGYYQDVNYDPQYPYQNSRKDTLTSISLSLPLDIVPVRSKPVFSTTYTKGSNDSEAIQAMVSGNTGVGSDASYSVGYTRDIKNSTDHSNIGLSKRFSQVALSSNASFGKDYKQGSVTATGSAVLHSGGITLGQYMGDTFALVEAKGAKGAEVASTNNVSIDRFGYAIVPSLVPFKYNSIALSSVGITNSRVEVDGGHQRVVPYAGAAVKVVFKTVEGYPVLISIQTADGIDIPIGANVLDGSGQVVGMVGQGGMAYIRSEQKIGDFTIGWGVDGENKCTFPIDLSSSEQAEDLIRLNAICT